MFNELGVTPETPIVGNLHDIKDVSKLTELLETVAKRTEFTHKTVNKVNLVAET